jgi:hypothetical protein
VLKQKNKYMDENIDNIINKFVKYKFKKSELEEIAPLIGTDDFNTHFELIKDIDTLMQEEGRNEIKKEVKNIIESEKKQNKKSSIIKMQDFKLQLVAASVLFTCSANVIKNKVSYNLTSKFTKTYTLKNERK